MTLAQIQSAMAGYLDTTVAAFTVGGVDLSLIALNQIRLQAEMLNDFEFSRKLVTVSVNGVTGGSLSSAVLYGTATPAIVKSVLEVGLFDGSGNLRPIEWTTVAESLERQREIAPGVFPSYPTDAQITATTESPSRLVFSGDNIFLFPKDATLTTALSVGLEVYTFAADWASIAAPSDIWTDKGQQYLMWQGVVHLNHRFKEFVFRQEGNLPSPEKLAEAGLEALRQWDIFKYEQFRRHG